MIESVDERAFEPCKGSMRFLNLSGNKITTLSAPFFHGWEAKKGLEMVFSKNTPELKTCLGTLNNQGKLLARQEVMVSF